MTRPWVSQVGRFVCLPFVCAGMLLLQLSLIGSGAAFDFCAFALVAIGALVGVATLRARGRPDFLCLSATALFCGYIVLRALTSPVPYSARFDLYLVLAVLTVYGVTAVVLSRSRDRIIFALALLGFAVCHVLVELIQFGLGENFILVPALRGVEASARGTGLYASPDHLAGLLEVLGILALSVSCWSRWPKTARVVIGYLSLVCYVGVALTGSRGGYLSVAASLLVFGILSLIVLRYGGSAFFLRWAGIGVIALLSAIYFGGSLMTKSATLTERLQQIVAVDEERLDLWHAAIEQWRLEPSIGTGSGTYRFYGRQFRTERMQVGSVEVHNDYLNLLCEYGLVGAVAFGFFFLAHVQRGFRNFVVFGPKRIALGNSPSSDRLALVIGALSSIAAYVIHSGLDFNLHIPANALLLAFVFGIVANAGLEFPDEDAPVRASRFARLSLALIAVILLVQCARLLPSAYFATRASNSLADEDPAAAYAFATKALAYEQDNPRIFLSRGRALIALAHTEENQEKRREYREAALTSFENARLLNPLDGTFPSETAMLLDEMGRFDEAETMYSLALARDPRSVTMRELYENHRRARIDAGK